MAKRLVPNGRNRRFHLTDATKRFRSRAFTAGEGTASSNRREKIRGKSLFVQR
jgi:hypothetical protein